VKHIKCRIAHLLLRIEFVNKFAMHGMNNMTVMDISLYTRIFKTSVQYFSSPTHYSPLYEEKNVFVFFLYFWLFSYYIMFKLFIPLPWRLDRIVPDTTDLPQNWGTMVLHWEQNPQHYCIRLPRWNPIKGVIYRTEVYIMRHVCVKNKSEFLEESPLREDAQLWVETWENLSKKKPCLVTLLIYLSSA